MLRTGNLAAARQETDLGSEPKAANDSKAGHSTMGSCGDGSGGGAYR
jgi:hypothetical protein